MFQISNKVWLLIVFSFFAIQANAQVLEAVAEDEGVEHHDLHEELSLKDEIKQDIHHHLLDSHYFDFLHDSETDTYYGFSLPVILWDNGLQVFMSDKFDHGKKVAEHKGNHYALYHNKIYKTDAQGTITYDEEGHPVNEKPLDFSITKSVMVIILTCIVMFLLFRAVANNYKNRQVPKGIAKYLEPLIVYVRDEIAIPNIGKKHYQKYMGFLLTIFFFIWILNILGLMPFGINVTGNIAVTFALALFTFLLTNFTGTRTYWGHIFDPLGDTMPWIAKIPIYIILIPIELLGLIVKPFSLMIRLYANISAGHIVLMSLIGLIFLFKNIAGSSMSLVLAVAISFIEFFVAALQAYIFTTLSALYFGFATEEHSDH